MDYTKWWSFLPILIWQMDPGRIKQQHQCAVKMWSVDYTHRQEDRQQIELENIYSKIRSNNSSFINIHAEEAVLQKAIDINLFCYWYIVPILMVFKYNICAQSQLIQSSISHTHLWHDDCHVHFDDFGYALNVWINDHFNERNDHDCSRLMNRSYYSR